MILYYPLLAINLKKASHRLFYYMIALHVQFKMSVNSQYSTSSRGLKIRFINLNCFKREGQIVFQFNRILLEIELDCDPLCFVMEVHTVSLSQETSHKIWQRFAWQCY